MNRLSPLVARTPRSFGRARLAVIGPASARASGFSDDVRLFLTAWAGGVAFFVAFFA